MSGFQLKNTKIHFETLGCRLNQIESESAARFFADAGFSVSMEGLTASMQEDLQTVLCIVNTCTVTTKAEQKARRLIRLLLKKYPHSAVVITGCYAQVEPAELLAIDSRISVLPGQNKGRLADLPVLLKESLLSSEKTAGDFNPVEFAHKLQKTLFFTGKAIVNEPEKIKQTKFVPVKAGTAEKPFRLSTDTFLSHSRSSLKIQDGCNCQCTYCRIHIARGNSVSLDAQEVIKRVQELKNAGQKEVVITTVNIGQYSSVWEGRKINFTDLLELLLQKTQGISFRLSSLYPEIVDERFARIIKDSRVCPHFHLSIQSGSDRILKLMKRPYLVDRVYRAIELLRQAKENPFIACDIIAGFPGETDEDFEQTLNLARWAEFTWIHAFPFSARPGTEAWFMKNKVPQSVAGRRVNQLLNLAIENKIRYIKNLEGRNFKAIAEKPLVLSDGSLSSRLFRAVSENFLHCIVDCQNLEIPEQGCEFNLKIERVLEAEIKKGEEAEVFAVLEES